MILITILLGLVFVLLAVLLLLHWSNERLQVQATSHLGKQDPIERDLIHSFGSALAHNEFSVRYQPKISVKTGKICGAELLVRWDHVKYGKIPPEQFITLAEKTGFIIPLGLWILKTACLQARQFKAKGYQHIRIAINLSAHQFKIGDVIEDIAKALTDYDLPPEMFEVELTESAFLHHTEKNLLMLKVLREMGVTISLDDFGMGYSSLKYLREFPLDALKIDRSFTRRVLSNDENENIIKAMVSLAKALHMKTIAEGIENKETAAFLTDLGVDELQGFYFYEPLTAEAFLEVLDKQSTDDMLPFKK